MADRTERVVAFGGVALGAVSLLVSILIARGSIRPPEEDLIRTYRGERLIGFGTACRTDRDDECLRAWSFEIETEPVRDDNTFVGTITWSFGSILTVEGRLTPSLIRFTETAIQSSRDPATDVECDYALVAESANQFTGTWAGCAGERNEGRIWLALDSP